MNKSIEFLRGKKTYFTVAIGVLYLSGCWLGFYEFDERVLAVLGLAGFAFLRSGIKKVELPMLLAAALVVGGAGCSTQNTSGRLLATTVTTVDAAMTAWGDYTRLHPVSAETHGQVRAAYESYQRAELAAERAYVAAAKLNDPTIFDVAATALRAAQTDLLALIELLQR